MFVKPVTGTGAEELVLSSPTQKAVEGWSPDGKFLILQRQHQLRSRRFPSSARRNHFRSSSGPGYSDHGALSPDGKWIAYRSTDLGRAEIYVQSFPVGGARWQLSTNGGSEPSWRRDGKELYFMRDRQLIRR